MRIDAYMQVSQIYQANKTKNAPKTGKAGSRDSLARKEFKVGTWIEAARSAGQTQEEKALYEWNARVQITTWGNRVAARLLCDYRLEDYIIILYVCHYAYTSSNFSTASLVTSNVSYFNT